MPPLSGHFSDYVEDVRELKRCKKLEEAEVLLLALIEAAEAESNAEGIGVAPWYYEQLAIVRRKRRDYAGEVAILERFMRKHHAPGAAPGRLEERLEKTRGQLARRLASTGGARPE